MTNETRNNEQYEYVDYYQAKTTEEKWQPVDRILERAYNRGVCNSYLERYLVKMFGKHLTPRPKMYSVRNHR